MSRALLMKLGSWRDAFLYYAIPSNVRLGPEDCLQRETYLLLCDLVTSGAYRGVFFHPANEALGKSPRARHRTSLLISLGMISGLGDWGLMWTAPDGTSGRGFIELKAPGNYNMEDSQKRFREWCTEFNVPYAVCKTKEQFVAKLREWGAIPPT